MRFWDTTLDKAIDETLDSLTIEEQEYIERIAISCKEKLIGAQ